MQHLASRHSIRRLNTLSCHAMCQTSPATKFDYSQKFVSANKLQKFEIKQRENILKQFEEYTQRILPQMEEQVEMRLIARQLHNVTDTSVRKLVLASYSKRRLQVEAEPELREQEPKHQMLIEDFSRVPHNIYSPVEIQEHSVEDIGLYNHYPVEDLDTYFRYGIFGDFKTEIMYTHQLTLMCTKEAFQLAQCIRLNPSLPPDSTLQKQLVLTGDYSLKEYQEVLYDETQYLGLFKLLSRALLDALQPHRSSPLAKRLFSMSHLFDSLVSVVLMEMRHSLFRNALYADQGKFIMTQVVEQFLAKVDPQEANGMLFKRTLRQVGSLELTLPTPHTIDLKAATEHNTNSHKYRPHRLHKFGLKQFHGQNSGALLWGTRGTGKSGVLAYLSLLGHKSNSVVLSVTDAHKWTQSDVDLTRHHKTGLFCQFGLAVEHLQHVLSCNQALLETIPVNKSLYGQMGISGQHANECPAVPNTYDPVRKTYFEDHKQFYLKDEQKKQEMDDLVLDQETLAIRLPAPTTLLDIVQFGITHPESSICAIAELLEQLYNIETHQVIITVDQFNWFYRPSRYMSYRYSSSKSLNGHVPPSHLALARLYMDFDGHRLRNGFKVVAAGHKHLYKHKFSPEKIHFGGGYGVEMKGLEVEEFANLLEHYNHHNMYVPHHDELTPVAQVHMEAQGNWEEALRMFTLGLRHLR